METKAQRAAKRRKRQRARQREKARRRAVPRRDDCPAWWTAGLQDVATEEIVATLATLGIETDETRFRDAAVASGGPEALADRWSEQGTATGYMVDYPGLAAVALWLRWAPDLFSVETFVEQHLPFEVLDKGDPATPEEARTHWQMATAVLDLVAPPTGLVRPELLEELTRHAGIDLAWWLGDLPFALARQGMVDEAVGLCRRMAGITEAEMYLGDCSVILADAGRREEALRQIAENLERFPSDVWVRLKAGDAYRAIGDPAGAEAVYRQALAMTPADRLDHERAGAVDRLVRLLEDTGRDAEADALLAAKDALAGTWKPELDFEDELPGDEDLSGPGKALDAPAPRGIPGTIVRGGPKVGRNDPCPCGSRRKYKHCCGA